VNAWFAYHSLGEQVPIEGFKVSDIKDNAVAFRDGTVVESVPANQTKDFIAALTSLLQALEQFVSDRSALSGNSHSLYPFPRARRRAISTLHLDKSMACYFSRSSLIYIAPDPCFPRLDGANERML
jgi:hypothetical protein